MASGPLKVSVDRGSHVIVRARTLDDAERKAGAILDLLFREEATRGPKMDIALGRRRFEWAHVTDESPLVRALHGSLTIHEERGRWVVDFCDPFANFSNLREQIAGVTGTTPVAQPLSANATFADPNRAAGWLSSVTAQANVLAADADMTRFVRNSTIKELDGVFGTLNGAGPNVKARSNKVNGDERLPSWDIEDSLLFAGFNVPHVAEMNRWVAATELNARVAALYQGLEGNEPEQIRLFSAVMKAIDAASTKKFGVNAFLTVGPHERVIVLDFPSAYFNITANVDQMFSIRDGEIVVAEPAVGTKIEFNVAPAPGLDPAIHPGLHDDMLRALDGYINDLATKADGILAHQSPPSRVSEAVMQEVEEDSPFGRWHERTWGTRRRPDDGGTERRGPTRDPDPNPRPAPDYLLPPNTSLPDDLTIADMWDPNDGTAPPDVVDSAHGLHL